MTFMCVRKKLIFSSYIYCGYIPYFMESIGNVAIQKKDKLFFSEASPP